MDIISTGELMLKKMLSPLKKHLWYKQLEEASKYKFKLTTMISSIAINILSLAFPLSLMQVYDRIIPNQSYASMIFLFVGVSAAIILETILKMIRSCINLWADTKYEYELSKKALDNLMHVPLYVYEKTDVGTRVKQFAILDKIRGFYNNQLICSIFDAPFLIIFLLVIAYIGGVIVFVPIFLGVMVFVLSFRMIEKWRNFMRSQLEHESKESDFLVNVIGSIHTAKFLGIENLLIRRYERMQESSNRINYDTSVQSGDLATIKSLAAQVNIVLMGSIGCVLVMTGQIAVGSLIACVLLAGRFMMPLIKLLAAFSRWKMINIVREQLDDVLDMPVTTDDEKIVIHGKIRLSNIGYYYEKKDQKFWLLKDLNLDVMPKTCISIIGGTQEQKEIILNILASVTRPKTGKYAIDDKDIDQFQNYNLRSKIAYISKSSVLFQGTIINNLSAFDSDLIPRAKEYAKRLGLDKPISKLPKGYNTLVGDKAVESLAGGVISLISIIRALVNLPSIILFEEANMNLDIASTKKLIELMGDLKEHASIIIISKTEETKLFSDYLYEIRNMKLVRVAINMETK